MGLNLVVDVWLGILPIGLRIAHGTEPAIGNERRILLSTAGERCAPTTATEPRHVDLLVAEAFRIVGCQHNWLDEIAQWVVSLELPL